jgi:hypothetical protein
LKCVGEIIRSLNFSVTLSNAKKPLILDFLENIISDCLANLNDPELKAAGECGKILLCCSSASPEACSIIIGFAVPVLIQKYEDQVVLSKKKILLEILVRLISNYKLTNVKNTNNESESPLDKFKDKIIEIFLSVFISESYLPLKSVALQGVYEFLSLNRFLVEKEVFMYLFSQNY